MALKKSELYSSLWKSCDELRGGMDASQYKDYVLTLLFMKYVSDKYAGDPNPIIEVPDDGGFADMVACKGQKDVGDRINKIIGRFAEANDLKGVIDQADFNDESKLGRGKAMQDRLTKLVAIFQELDFSTNWAGGDDLLGDAYEYLMRHFATQSGKAKGQFYTPAEVSCVMAQIIGIGTGTRQDHTLYDPTCGSGSLLLKAAEQAPGGLTIYGQEMDNATWGLARMNMILHEHPTAVLRQGDTLSEPLFGDPSIGLKTFDFAVANPPFSTKSWANGFDPGNDQFDRFEYGIPPDKNGDYAFLLHLIKSLSARGRGAIILPHGVLFRGHREAAIRRKLISHGLIKGLIGLPDNLFYGTTIPACIVVVDKEEADVRQGIFMIDASKGFRKEGPKNRLRAQDIRRIVDVFNQQTEIPHYSRMVPFTEISESANDFNLNMSRYIDSSESEDVHDLSAHVYGGIPNRDLDALGDYWEIFPSLRGTLFKPSNRSGYSDLQVAPEDLKATILSHSDFTSYKSRVIAVFDDWYDAHRERLRAISTNVDTTDLLDNLARDLLGRVQPLPLLDRYDIYQCLMDYWDYTMQDDVYQIASEGWVDAAQPTAFVPDAKVKPRATPDLIVRREKWKIDLIPPELLAERYFSGEHERSTTLRASHEAADRELRAYLQEHAREGGVLADAVNKDGTVTKKRLATLAELEKTNEEMEIYRRCYKLLATKTRTKIAAAKAQNSLNFQVLARYKTLTPPAVKELVIEDKWSGALRAGVHLETKRVLEHMVLRITCLANRYSRPLPAIERDVAVYQQKMAGHLRADGRTRTSNKLHGRDQMLVKTVCLGEIGSISGGGVDKRSNPGETPVRLLNYLDVYRKTFIRSCDLSAVASASDAQLEKCRIKKGDIFFTPSSEVRNDIGRCAVALEDIPDGVYSYHVVRLRPYMIELDAGFAAYAFASEEFLSQASQVCQGSGTRYVITLPQFRSMRVALPSSDEQRAVATVLSDLDSFVEALDQSKTKISAIRHAMMHELFAKRIRVGEPGSSISGNTP